MSLFKAIQAALYVLLGLVGLTLFGLGAYGSLHVRSLDLDLAWTVKQRLQVSAFGLLLLAIAWVQLGGAA
jgi:hypothetical protein